MHAIALKMWVVAETTNEKGDLIATAVPKSWIKEGRLYWPRSDIYNARKNRISVDKSSWTARYYHKISVLFLLFWLTTKINTKSDLKNFHDALAKEKQLETYTDEESFNRQADTYKQKRKHPVNSKTSGIIDRTDMFKNISRSRKIVF